MWCDWSNRAQVSAHATCSSRQFENSAATFGYTYGPIWELRAISTAPPTSYSRSSRL